MPLHMIGDAVRQALGQIPLPLVRGLFLAVPVAIFIWILRLPREQTTPPGGHSRWDENLKLWAGLALLVQILVYSIF